MSGSHQSCFCPTDSKTRDVRQSQYRASLDIIIRHLYPVSRNSIIVVNVISAHSHYIMSLGAAPVFKSCWGRTMHAARLAEWIPAVFLLAVLVQRRIIYETSQPPHKLSGFNFCSKLFENPQVFIPSGCTNTECTFGGFFDHGVPVAAFIA